MKYFVRSLKYFLKLCVICTGVFFVMVWAKMTLVTPAQAPDILFHTAQGWILIAAAAVLSAFYPRFGFLTRRIEGDKEQLLPVIVETMRSVGYTPASDDGERLVFRASNPLQRLSLLFEDAIVVTQYGQWILLDGPGKHVVRAENKLQSFSEQARK